MNPDDSLKNDLIQLKLHYCANHFQQLATTAAQKQWSHLHFLAELIHAQMLAKLDRATQLRIQQARFPQIKTLEQFQWSWPHKINQPLVQHLFRLAFINKNENVVFMGGVGLGKTHLACAIGYQACLKGHRVLFSSAISAINNLAAANVKGLLKFELKKFAKPQLLILDELGYLPLDKTGTDLLFQLISERYEKGALIVTTNKAFKDWPSILNNDSVLTAALLDRFLHHNHTVIIEGKSFRMKDLVQS